MSWRCWRCDSATPNPACSDLHCPLLDNASVGLRGEPVPLPPPARPDGRYLAMDCNPGCLTAEGCEHELQYLGPSPAPDPVNHPPHYTRGGLELIDVVEQLGLGYHVGNAFAYLWRADHKGGPDQALEDLRKARWYLDREIARREKAAGG